MWTEITAFFSDWLDSTFDVPIPFTDNQTIDLVNLVGLIVLLFVLIWVLTMIKRIIDSFISIF